MFTNLSRCHTANHARASMYSKDRNCNCPSQDQQKCNTSISSSKTGKRTST